jgi:hypothetical protein
MACAAVALVLVTPQGAAAGGAVFDLDDEFYYWNQEVVTATSFNNDIRGAGFAADGPWFGYLRIKFVPSQRTGHDWAPVRDVSKGAVPLGRVTFNRLDGSLFRARLSFTVPEVSPGNYVIQLCNRPCDELLGDIVGAGLIVTRTETEAVLSRQIERSRLRLTHLIDRVAQGLATAHHRDAQSRR